VSGERGRFIECGFRAPDTRAPWLVPLGKMRDCRGVAGTSVVNQLSIDKMLDVYKPPDCSRIGCAMEIKSGQVRFNEPFRPNIFGDIRRYFGNASPLQIRHFLDSTGSRPVRIWRNVDIGRVATTHFGHFVPSNSHADPSPFAGNSPLEFLSPPRFRRQIQPGNDARATFARSSRGMSCWNVSKLRNIA